MTDTLMPGIISNLSQTFVSFVLFVVKINLEQIHLVLVIR
jgi:hypothetical protein